MKYRPEAFLLSLGFLAYPLTADASTVQNLSAFEAEKGVAPVLNVCRIQGYNLSFLQINGGIVHVKLVDPSQTHVSFDVDKPSTSTPAKVIYLRQIERLKFKGLPAAEEGQTTTLSVRTNARKLYRFKVAFGCPSNYDTGIIQGPVASSPRRRRFQRPQPRQLETPAPIIENLDPVVPKPKAKVSKAVAIPVPPPVQKRIIFGNQYVVKGGTLDLYGLTPLQEEVEVAPVEVVTEDDPEVGLVPPPSPGNTFVPKRVAKAPAPVSASKIAWHLNRGLHIAKGKGEINYNTFTYRKWQNVIARVRKHDQTLEDAIKAEAPKGKLAEYQEVGFVLLGYGGLK